MPKHIPNTPRTLVGFEEEASNKNETHGRSVFLERLHALKSCLDALNISKKKIRRSEGDWYEDLYYVLHDKDMSDVGNKEFILKPLIQEGFHLCPVVATCLPKRIIWSLQDSE